jgi:ABC-type sugar transport system substrate-binding protein
MLVLISLVICGGSSAIAAEKKVVGIAHYSTADQGAALYATIARKHCDEQGWNYVFLDANNDAEKQAKDFQDLINMKVDAILTVPCDSLAISDSVIAANKAGIPVLLMDRSCVEGDFLCLVQSDNEKHGYESGVIMSKIAKAQGVTDVKVIEIYGDLASSAGKERSAGFQRAAKEFGFSILQSLPADWDTDKGYAMVMDGFTAHPDANALFLPSDNCYAAAALSALDQLKLLKKVGEPDHIIITCVDGGSAALDGIRNNDIDATASQQVSYMPIKALEYFAKYVNGEMAATANEVVELGPIVVTKDNVDSKELWANNLE